MEPFSLLHNLLLVVVVLGTVATPVAAAVTTF